MFILLSYHRHYHSCLSHHPLLSWLLHGLLFSLLTLYAILEHSPHYGQTDLDKVHKRSCHFVLPQWLSMWLRLGPRSLKGPTESHNLMHASLATPCIIFPSSTLSRLTGFLWVPWTWPSPTRHKLQSCCSPFLKLLFSNSLPQSPSHAWISFQMSPPKKDLPWNPQCKRRLSGILSQHNLLFCFIGLNCNLHTYFCDFLYNILLSWNYKLHGSYSTKHICSLSYLP